MMSLASGRAPERREERADAHLLKFARRELPQVASDVDQPDAARDADKVLRAYVATGQFDSPAIAKERQPLVRPRDAEIGKWFEPTRHNQRPGHLVRLQHLGPGGISFEPLRQCAQERFARLPSLRIQEAFEDFVERTNGIRKRPGTLRPIAPKIIPA